nr:hypothetical protein [Nocardia pseudobrasiliensis]
MTVDGPGGVGKTAVVAATIKYLQTLDLSVHATRQPSSNPFGATIRAFTDSVGGLALAKLVAGDRHLQQDDEIGPNLVVSQLDIADDDLPRILPGRGFGAIDAFVHQVAIERFSPAVIQHLLDATYRTADTKLLVGIFAITSASSRRRPPIFPAPGSPLPIPGLAISHAISVSVISGR